MSKATLKELERYRRKNALSSRALAGRLGVYPVYIFRWRKAGKIIGAYERIVEDFLNKEEEKEAPNHLKTG